MADLNTPNSMFLASIAKDYSLDFPDRIDEYTQEQIANIADDWLRVKANRVAIDEALVGVISEQTVTSLTFTNPLAEVEQADFPYGETEQEIYINFAKGYRYNPFASVADAFNIYRSYILTAYHHVNWEMQYAVTISRKELRKAFLTQYGFQSLIDAKIASLRSGYQWDSFITTKELIESAIESGHVYTVQVTNVTDRDSALALLVELQDYATLMSYPNTSFNPAGATSFTQDTGNLVLITTSRINALLRVWARSSAYHIEQLNNEARQISIDRFRNPAIVAFLCDIRWFHIRTQDGDLDDQKNAAAGYINMFLTGIKMVSYSPMYPAVAFVTFESTQTGITIGNATVPQGGEVTLEVEVTGTNPRQTYDLELTGATSQRTGIVPGTPKLFVGYDELATTLTVTAKAREADDVTSTATITVTPVATTNQIGARLNLGGKK